MTSCPDPAGAAPRASSAPASLPRALSALVPPRPPLSCHGQGPRRAAFRAVSCRREERLPPTLCDCGGGWSRRLPASCPPQTLLCHGRGEKGSGDGLGTGSSPAGQRQAAESPSQPRCAFMVPCRPVLARARDSRSVLAAGACSGTASGTSCPELLWFWHRGPRGEPPCLLGEHQDMRASPDAVPGSLSAEWLRRRCLHSAGNPRTSAAGWC